MAPKKATPSAKKIAEKAIANAKDKNFDRKVAKDVKNIETRVKSTLKKVAADSDDEKSSKRPKLDLLALYSDTMDVIAKRQGFEASSLDVAPHCPST